ncbi:MAG: divalent-cation tolerance protein CutA [Gemmatimonadales bacterium]|jgi:periplasmic divalent cation tolerance protein
MADRNKFAIFFVTAPDGQCAEALARKLLEERLVACVNIVPGLRSFYWWEGEVEASNEVLMLLKARRADIGAVTERVRGLHPYEVPEVIAADISGGLQAYLEWLGAETERG